MINDTYQYNVAYVFVNTWYCIRGSKIVINHSITRYSVFDHCFMVCKEALMFSATCFYRVSLEGNKLRHIR